MPYLRIGMRHLVASPRAGSRPVGRGRTASQGRSGGAALRAEVEEIAEYKAPFARRV